MCINAFIRLAGTSALAFETLAVGPTCGALSASYEPRCPLLLIRRSQEMGFSLREIADLLLGLFLAKPPRQGSRAGVQAVDLHTGRITGNVCSLRATRSRAVPNSRLSTAVTSSRRSGSSSPRPGRVEISKPLLAELPLYNDCPSVQNCGGVRRERWQQERASCWLAWNQT